MLLGKRPRHPIRRTTSVSGINLEALLPSTSVSGINVEGLLPSDSQQHPVVMKDQVDTWGVPPGSAEAGPSWYDHHRLMSTVSPRYHGKRGTGDHTQIYSTGDHFLGTCGLCKRRLAPSGRDIYMYRGDTAFCSLECREQQMKHDEGIEKRPS